MRELHTDSTGDTNNYREGELPFGCEFYTLAVTVRVTLGELINPYMTARMFVRFVQINRAILIPKDFRGNTIIIIDAEDSLTISEKVKKIKADLKYEFLGQSFE